MTVSRDPGLDGCCNKHELTLSPLTQCNMNYLP
jgi:hypothetical protein